MEFVFLSSRKGINWFRLNRELHRDLGFLCIGMTIVYAVSGIALNHIHDWNPNYIVQRYEQPFTLGKDAPEEQLNQQLLAAFSVSEQIKASYWESPEQYKLFFKGGGSLTANFVRSEAVYEQVRPRPVFREFNFLHLNEAKHGWILFADVYAGMLLFLAISALFMVRGKYSPWRAQRGWLVIAGLVLPAVYIFV